MDKYSGMKLKELCFEEPSAIKLRGVGRKLYAYRIGKGTEKERVVISSKGLSRKRFESYYRKRWAVEVEIKRLKAVAIVLWTVAVWHVELERIRAME